MDDPSVNQLHDPAAVAHWVQHPQALQAWWAECPPDATIALDTEFLRERTFHAQLALVQLSDGQRIALVDPLQEGMCEALKPILGSAVTTLLHAAGEDHGVLQHAVGSVLHTPWDTQIAAVCAGHAPNLGLRELVRLELGIELDKDQTRSDWTTRPLSTRQLQYAAADVQFLHAVRDRLLPRIAARGLTQACAEECLRLRDLSLEGPPPAQPHWSVHRIEEWDEAAQRRAWRLLRWREWRARATDRPRSWLLPPPLLMALATRAPQSSADIETILHSLQQGGGSRRAETLWEVLQQDPADGVSFQPAPTALTAPQRRVLQALRLQAERVAAEVALPVEWLAPRRLLEAWAREDRFPAAWGDWRARLLMPVPAPAPAPVSP